LGKGSVALFVILLVVGTVLAAANGGYPRSVRLIPFDRLPKTVRESDARLPAQFTSDLAAVERIAAVVTGAVAHIG
jgi:hypothetical protein